MQLVKITRLLGLLIFACLPALADSDEKWGAGSNEHLKSYQQWKQYNREFDECYRKKDRRKAIHAAYNSLRVAEENASEKHPAMVTTLYNLALIHSGTTAIEFYTRALAIQQKQSPNAALIVKILVGLGENHAKLHEQGKSTATAWGFRSPVNHQQASKVFYERALPLLERQGSDPQKIASILEELADIYKQEGDITRAVQYHERSLLIKMKIVGKNHTDLIAPLRNLSGLYVVLKRYKESEKLERFATQIEAMRR